MVFLDVLEILDFVEFRIVRVFVVFIGVGIHLSLSLLSISDFLNEILFFLDCHILIDVVFGSGVNIEVFEHFFSKFAIGFGV